MGGNMENIRMNTADMIQYCNEALAWEDFAPVDTFFFESVKRIILGECTPFDDPQETLAVISNRGKRDLGAFSGMVDARDCEALVHLEEELSAASGGDFGRVSFDEQAEGEIFTVSLDSE